MVKDSKRCSLLLAALGLIGALLLELAGCRGPQEQPPVSSPASAQSALQLAALPPRAEVVAMADALAVSGTRVAGLAGKRLTLRAARLRERLWRIDHRETDGLEALELYQELERGGGSMGCAAALDRALLAAELRTDLAAAYRTAYATRARAEDSQCTERAETVLLSLAAFRPLPNVLAEIDHKLAGQADAGASSSSSASVRVDPRGPVVVPSLKGKPRRGPIRVTGVERYGAKDAARIVVFLTYPALFDVGYIGRQASDRGPRLYVDIKQAHYKGPLAQEVGGLVQRVRFGKRDSGTRVVLDLATDVYRRVFYLPEPFRLVIDVSTEPPRAGQTKGGEPRALRRVVLDPGHGGHDPGATGPAGLAEKDVTLDIAHRAAPLIARELGIATLLTRDSDEFVPLDERTARANAFQADLFISIHCNAADSAEQHGVMTFVLDESADALAAHIAARENAASPAAAAELATVLSRIQDAGSVARCVRFAELLQRAAMASLRDGYSGVPDRGVRRAGFYVLAGATMPAVLFEASFISNPAGEMHLNTAQYRQKLADAIVNAVRAYRDGR